MNPRLLRPSQIMQKAYEGLLSCEKRAEFKFHKDTFGYFGGASILGNLSTCAVQEIAGKQFSGAEVNAPGTRADYLGWDGSDLWRLESAINAVTCGNAVYLMQYCKIPVRKSVYLNRSLAVTAAPEYYKDPVEFRGWLLQVIKELQVIEEKGLARSKTDSE